jgi:GH24 family phage-related lysozyme (muramidase)
MGKTTSAAGIALLKQFEGCRLVAYKALPTEQYYTIGYGHYGSDITANMTITQAQAETMLKNDLKRYEKPVNDYVQVDITQNMFDALVSFCYNCGGAALKGSTLLKKLNTKDYIGAAAQFSVWNKSGGNVINGLIKRRAAEAELFLKGYGEYTPISTITPKSSTKDIKWLKEKLNKANTNYTIPVTGIFDYKTSLAVKIYADLKGWKKYETATGYTVGVNTIKELSKI